MSLSPIKQRTGSWTTRGERTGIHHFLLHKAVDGCSVSLSKPAPFANPREQCIAILMLPEDIHQFIINKSCTVPCRQELPKKRRLYKNEIKTPMIAKTTVKHLNSPGLQCLLHLCLLHQILNRFLSVHTMSAHSHPQ